MTKPIVESSALVRLIELELVNQYKRFVAKRLTISPRNCIFNAWVKTPDGGYVRMCQVPARLVPARYTSSVANPSGLPCTTLSKAKKCPLYIHYTGSGDSLVVPLITKDFIERLADTEKRSSSFKALHTLWLLLHEVEVINISWTTRMQLRLAAYFFKRKYHAYMIKNTPQAEVAWETLLKNFRTLVTNP